MPQLKTETKLEEYMEYLSDMLLNMTESATLAMAAKARELKQSGVDIISLSLGEPDFKTPDHIRKAAKEAIDDGNYFSYPPVPGYLDLREVIAEKFRRDNGLKSEVANIVVSTGAKQSIANVMLSLLNPGDEAIVLSPYWVSYSEIIRVAGGVPVFVKGTIENDFKASAAQIKDAITDKTKILIYSSPCNPTGSVFTGDELREIADVLEGHPGIFVVADEIYEHINFTDSHTSIGSIEHMQDRTVTVNGVSKAYAMTGWRIGFINAPQFIAKACTKIQGQFTSGANSIAQRAALAALTADNSTTLEMANEYLERRGMVHKLLTDIPGLKTNMPKGAFYFFPDVSEFFGTSFNSITIKNASDMSMYLLNEANVSVVTGEAFGSPECIRISYAASRDELTEALERIKNVLANLN